MNYKKSRFCIPWTEICRIKAIKTFLSLWCFHIVYYKIHYYNFLLFRTTKWKAKESSLSDFARHAMKEMFRQEWVREKFLKDPDAVLSSDLLLDQMLTNKQVCISMKYAHMAHSTQYHFTRNWQGTWSVLNPRLRQIFMFLY